jgi:ATP-binding cassette, subfamily B, bacterial
MSLLKFQNVTFGYDDSKLILDNVNITLDQGKTYALVGPTGGGKTTTAYLMSRLYSPISGSVTLFDKDIEQYSSEDLTGYIGYILQDPFMFTGTIRGNIIYGNSELESKSNEELEQILTAKNLLELFDSFDEGLETQVANDSNTLSLGQKQIIAFVRVILRNPKLLILDEATANIDTVTEQILTSIIDSLPSSTTKVIIAHRLNTIKYADQIFFVNEGRIKATNSIEEVLEMIKKN